MPPANSHLKGLKDKLYWRRVGAAFHCFAKASGGKLVSLCKRHSLERSGGQKCNRPLVLLRCHWCDVLEMERRGWDESGDPS